MYDNLEKEFDRKQIDIVRRELTAKNKRLPTYIELLAELYLQQGPQSNKHIEPTTKDCGGSCRALARKEMKMNHPDPQVQKAIIRLDDALCMWERSTFRQSILIIREMGGFVHRSVSGKPGVPDDVTDEQLMNIVTHPTPKAGG